MSRISSGYPAHNRRLDLADDLGEGLDLLLDLALLHHFLDLLHRVQDGAVVAVELLPDGVKRHVEYLAAQVHGDLTRVGNLARATLSHEVGVLDLEEGLDLLLNILDREVARGAA